jgi:uncharacterized small protein (DUF1192 family)
MRNFKKMIGSKYQILSVDELTQRIDEVTEELNDVEVEIKKVRDEYKKLVADDNATYEQLLAVEKKLDQLESDRVKAEKKYENARNTTMQDLKEEQAWKGDR